MQVNIYTDETELSRNSWMFNLNADSIVLTHYSEEKRKTKRHKFVGPIWSAFDVRHHYSTLDRPKTIPEEVLFRVRQLWYELFGTPGIYIGWKNEESRLK